MTKKKQMRIYRYYNGKLIGVTNDKHLKMLDENKAMNIINGLTENGSYKQGEILYSLKSIENNTNNTNISCTKHIGGKPMINEA